MCYSAETHQHISVELRHHIHVLYNTRLYRPILFRSRRLSWLPLPIVMLMERRYWVIVIKSGCFEEKEEEEEEEEEKQQQQQQQQQQLVV